MKGAKPLHLPSTCHHLNEAVHLVGNQSFIEVENTSFKGG